MLLQTVLVRIALLITLGTALWVPLTGTRNLTAESVAGHGAGAGTQVAARISLISGGARIATLTSCHAEAARPA